MGSCQVEFYFLKFYKNDYAFIFRYLDGGIRQSKYVPFYRPAQSPRSSPNLSPASIVSSYNFSHPKKRSAETDSPDTSTESKPRNCPSNSYKL